MIELSLVIKKSYEIRKGEFIMFFKKKSDPSRLELTQELEGLHQELKQAYHDFELATKPELVDASIYHINALFQKQQYLLTNLHTMDEHPPHTSTRKIDKWW